MDADSGSASPLPPPPPLPTTIVFRDWHTLARFVGNARVALGANEGLLFSFARAPRTMDPQFGGRAWPSYHHAAVSLCGDILAAVEHAIDRMKLSEMPKNGALPADLEKRLRLLVATDFDPAILLQGCVNEAARAGFTTGTWRRPTPQYSGDFRISVTTVPIPGDEEKPTRDDPEQFHLDCFYMLSALSVARVVSANDLPSPTLSMRDFVSSQPQQAAVQERPVPNVKRQPQNLTLREKNILEALGDGELSGPQVAEKAGYEYNSALRSALSNMVKRELIEKGDYGYRTVR
jgi:hypothetical protein